MRLAEYDPFDLVFDVMLITTFVLCVAVFYDMVHKNRDVTPPAPACEEVMYE